MFSAMDTDTTLETLMVAAWARRSARRWLRISRATARALPRRVYRLLRSVRSVAVPSWEMSQAWVAVSIGGLLWGVVGRVRGCGPARLAPPPRGGPAPC